MAEFSSFDGVCLRFSDEGAGRPVVLLHGFLVDGDLNWRHGEMVGTLIAAGYRVIIPDARGHGRSDKPHDPHSYGGGALVRDVLELAAHLQFAEVALVGYSMGADVAARTASCSGIVQALVLGGVGGSLADPPDLDPAGVAATLRQVAPFDGPAPGAELRELADALGSDKLAAAALFEGLGRQGSPEFSAVRCPVLVIAGADDQMSGGSPESLGDRYIRGRSIVLPGLDHLSAVFAPEFTAAVVAFLSETYPPAR